MAQHAHYGPIAVESNSQSLTAVAQVFSASQMRIKLIARVMAEGVRDVFSLLHATIRKHGQQLEIVRLRNAWVNVDPRAWKTRDDMTINVALGSGGNAQQFAQTMAIGNIQKQLVAAGKTNMVDDRELYNIAVELTRIMGQERRRVLQRSRRDQPADRPAPAPTADAAIAAARSETVGGAGEGAGRCRDRRASGAAPATKGAERRDPSSGQDTRRDRARQDQGGSQCQDDAAGSASEGRD